MSDEKTSGPDFYEDDSGEEIDDDFLYHLYQGGDLLQNNRVVEAKDHLEKAFSLKPGNPRGQNLLGLVYFRLGLYQRAVDIYQDLVTRFPDDPTLRVNLAMVYFKAEQLDLAEDELRQAVALDSAHRNANRYLGLVLARKGDQAAARAHFERAGVRNVDELLGVRDEGPGGVSEQCREEIETDQIAAIAAVADEGFKELDEKEMPFEAAGSGSTLPPESGDAAESPAELEGSPQAEHPAASASVQSSESMAGAGQPAQQGETQEETVFSRPPALETAPLQMDGQDGAEAAADDGETEEAWQTREARAVEAEVSGSVDAGAAGKTPATLPPSPFVLEPAGLSVDLDGQVYSRLHTLRWAEGDLAYAAVYKRFAGEDTRHSFDRDDKRMTSITGRGFLRLAHPEDMKLEWFSHREGSAYLVEDAVFAFTQTRQWENGRLPSNGDEDLPIFHLFAPGHLILACSGSLIRKPLASGGHIRIRAAQLVGWVGNLVPRLFVGEPPLPRLLWIDLSGEGEVLCVD